MTELAPGHCSLGKVAYPTDRDARKALNRLIKVRAVARSDRMEDHSYKCPVCGAWHLTSKTRGESW